jgi:hypothetical protein
VQVWCRHNDVTTSAEASGRRIEKETEYLEEVEGGDVGERVLVVLQILNNDLQRLLVVIMALHASTKLAGVACVACVVHLTLAR